MPGLLAESALLCAYSTNYLVDIHAGVIVDVEATGARASAKLALLNSAEQRVWSGELVSDRPRSRH